MEGYGNRCIHDRGGFFFARWLLSAFIFLFWSARHLASFSPSLSGYGGGAPLLQSLQLLPVFIQYLSLLAMQRSAAQLRRTGQTDYVAQMKFACRGFLWLSVLLSEQF